MRPTRLPPPALLLVLGLCACARPPETVASAPADAAPPAASAPAEAPTASAGTIAAASLPGGPGVDAAAAQCREDADCTLTRLETDGCCETLCVARAVPKAELAALEASQRRCEARQGACPERVCPPPRFSVQPACQAGRCEVRRQLDE